MCGIVGIINKDKSKLDENELSSALQTIVHRGPDAQGIYVHKHVGLGNVRLAILDLEPRSDMPMHYENLTITYNGEVYNYKEIRETLIDEGYTFDTLGDTEVVLKSYHKWGAKCLDQFNGMWAFAILDRDKNTIFCARDRFGIKPFYYTEIKDTFCFASEIKAFTKIDGWEAKVNQNTAYNYLVYGMQDYSHETMFENVFHLPASHYMVYDIEKGVFDIQKYYSLQKENKDLSLDEAIDKFRHLLDDSLRLRFRSDVKVGSCLSGGLDSSSVVTYSADKIIKDTAFETVSAVYPNTPIDESKYVQDIVKEKGVINHSFSPDLEQLIDDLPGLLWTQDEPFSSASIFAQNKVFNKAKQTGIKVMLDGQGGDEILAGYDVFYASYIKGLLPQKPLRAFSEVFHFFKSYQDSYANAIKNYMASRNKEKTNNHDWLKIKSSTFNKPISTDRSDIFSTSTSLLFRMGIQTLLHYEDRNSMAHSIESRLPFLDYRLVEFCLSLPDQMKIYKGRRKHILRESMKPHLPHSIYDRLDKKGFETPQEVWFQSNRDKIKNRIKELYTNTDIIAIDSLPDNDQVLWRVLLFGEWLSVFKVAV